MNGSAQIDQTASTFSFNPASAGSYSITATVTDSSGTLSAQSNVATVTVYVTPSLPLTSAATTVTSTIPVGGNPISIAVTPNGAYAYVTNGDGTVSVISTATNTVTATITLPDFYISYSPPESGPDSAGYVTPDPWGVAMTPNGEYVYVTNAYGDETETGG